MRTVAITIALGLAFGFVFISLRATGPMSRMRLYDSMYLGMDRSQAERALAGIDASCGGPNQQHDMNKCSFRDIWREYIVSFDPETKRLNRKSYHFKRQDHVI